MPRARGIWNAESFFLELAGGAIPWDNLPNRGLYAVYDNFPDFGDRLHIVEGVDALRQTIETLLQQGKIPTRVFVATAATKEDLPDPEYVRSVRAVLRGIELIKKRGDKARLRLIRAALERKGGRPGPKADPAKSAWLIGVLKELATGKPLLKQVRLRKPWKPASASAKLSQFCWDFYQLCTLFGANSPREWQEEYVARTIRDRFGFRFPDDLTAAQEAFRRGQASLDRALQRSGKQRFDPPSLRGEFRQL